MAADDRPRGIQLRMDDVRHYVLRGPTLRALRDSVDLNPQRAAFTAHTAEDEFITAEPLSTTADMHTFVGDSLMAQHLGALGLAHHLLRFTIEAAGVVTSAPAHGPNVTLVGLRRFHLKHSQYAFGDQRTVRETLHAAADQQRRIFALWPAIVHVAHELTRRHLKHGNFTVDNLLVPHDASPAILVEDAHWVTACANPPRAFAAMMTDMIASLPNHVTAPPIPPSAIPNDADAPGV